LDEQEGEADWKWAVSLVRDLDWGSRGGQVYWDWCARAAGDASNESGLSSFEDESRAQADLVREIMGWPFHPHYFDARWRTSDTVGLAQAIYDDRAFDRMPILADALMDAGCEDEQIIGHCRSDGPHVRGCWVVDLLLGKE
jgi:hypothetical protein